MVSKKVLHVSIIAIGASARPSIESEQTTVEEPQITNIVGGEEIVRQSKPYLVSIGKGNEHLFAGSLITPNAVLTSAHNHLGFEDNGTPYWSPAEWVEFYRHDLTDVDRDVIRMYLDGDEEAGDIVIHPLFNISSAAYDIGIIFLPRPMDGITPVHLNEDPDVPSNDGATVEVVGWGVDESGNSSDVPRNAVLDYVPNEKCMEPHTSWNESLITPDMMCTSSLTSSVCVGDGGAPVVLSEVEPNEPVVQVGIVSWLYDCYSPEYPTLNARVSAGIEWIKSTVCDRTGDFCPPVPTAAPSAPLSKSSKLSPKSGKQGDDKKKHFNQCVYSNPTLDLSELIGEGKAAIEVADDYNEEFADAVDDWIDGAASPDDLFDIGKNSDVDLSKDEVCALAFGLIGQMEPTCFYQRYLSAYANVAANIMHGTSYNMWNDPVDILKCLDSEGSTFYRKYSEYLTKETLYHLMSEKD